MSELREGDVFELRRGMRVYTEVSERFAYGNRSGSNQPTKHDVTVGEIYRDGGVMWDSSDLCGEYLVTATTEDGGGTGMGPHDTYPDGHHVFAMKLDRAGVHLITGGGVSVDFYQSGCFTAMNPEVSILRRMKKRVTWS